MHKTYSIMITLFPLRKSNDQGEHIQSLTRKKSQFMVRVKFYKNNFKSSETKGIYQVNTLEFKIHFFSSDLFYLESY